MNWERLFNSKRNKRLFYTLACIVVFVTTYMLVLPALTIDEQTAIDDPAIDNSTLTQEETTINELETVADPFEIEQEREAALNNAETESVTVNEEETETVIEKENAVSETKSDVLYFYDDSTDIKVSVEAPKEAFPEGVYMIVTPIESEEVLDTINDTLNNSKVKRVQAVDITFYDKDGNEIEPACEIKVSLVSDLIKDAKDTTVVHIDNEGKGSIVEQSEEDSDDDEVKFESKDFSTYAVVMIETYYIDDEGDTYKITVSYDEKANIPQGSYLEVTEIEKNNSLYNDYYQEINRSLDREEIKYLRLFDISIYDENGNKIQPDSKVSVKIELDDLNTTVDDTKAVHLNVLGDPDVLETLISKEDSSINFETDGFSVYAVVGTEIIEEGKEKYSFYGDGFKVVITVPEAANVPIGTELIVSEIDSSSDEYIEHLGQAWFEINKEYLEVEKIRNDISEDLDLSQYDMDIRPINIDGARFFDIKFMNGEEEIEPEVPVTVEISYDEGFKASEETIAGVAHYVKDGIEIIKNVDTIVEDGEIVSFKYEQESFSDTGTYVGQETTDEEGVIGNYDVSITYPNYDNLLTEEEAEELKLAAATKNASTTLKAAGLNAPATNKNLISNGDGSYTLALSVTGAAQSSSSTNVTKSNVVIVMDRSNSMSSNVYSYTPYTGAHQSGTTYYGYYNNQYITLYYNNGTYYRTRTGGGWGGYNYSNPYSGTVYTRTQSNRLDEEQAALDTVVGTLLAQNKPGQTTTDGTSLADILEIKVISFATGRGDGSQNSGNNWSGNTESGWSTDKDTLMGYVNNDSRSTGTNWEEAMEYALSVANAKKQAQPDENVYVIFLTDGEPTTHNGSYNVNTNYSDELQQAEPDAKAIVDAGHTFYSIFTYGSGTSADYLRRLVNYAYGNGDNTNASDALTKYFFDATDTSALTSALQNIVQDITNSVGYTNVDLTDGVTSMTSTNLKTSTDGSVTGLKYYRSGGTDADDNEKYDHTANDGLGVEWTDAPAATINENGEVEWDLDDLVLEDGVTYTLTFVVWPSQQSVDLVADLNNHKVTYDSLTDAQKSQIMVSGGMYVLKTNTDYPTVTYSTVTTTTINGETTTVTSDPVTANITNPDPIGLSEARMTVEKKWDDSLDPSQREEVEGSVVLDLTKDKTLYMENIEISDETDWKIPEAVCIAPGLMVTSDSSAYDPDATHVTYGGVTYAIIEPGHDYIFSEEDINSHFELTAYSHHPMLVNGTLTYVTFTYDDSGNITGVSDMYEAATLSATNTIKGGINVEKKVVDLDGNEIESYDPFTLTVHLTDADGNALPVKTTSDGTSYSYDYRYYYGEKNPAYEENADKWDEDGNIIRSRSPHIYGTGTSFDITLYPGDVVRVVNIESGALYYVTETLNSSSQYALQSVDYTIAVGTGSATSYNESTVGETVTKDGNTWYSVEGNSASSAVVTNKIPVANVGLLKIGDGQEENPLANVTFDLYSTYDAKNPDNNVIAKDASGNEIKNISTDKDGKVNIGNLLGGTYYLVETSTNDGYNMLTSPVKIFIQLTPGGQDYTVSYIQDDYVASLTTGLITNYDEDGAIIGYTITINNPSGSPLPNTGGPGTSRYIILGSMLITGSLLYEYSLRRNRKRKEVK
ncbi:MAG: hypothetical protein IJI66_17040 [Erysipelotrichaceae bacterium]|nr:hypothetical protein [Erysipelotrichaceae bacterium]